VRYILVLRVFFFYNKNITFLTNLLLNILELVRFYLIFTCFFYLFRIVLLWVSFRKDILLLLRDRIGDLFILLFINLGGLAIFF